MFRKSIVLLMLVALPIAADAQHRSRTPRARSPRAEAMAPPPGLAEALLPAGSRRTPSVRFHQPDDDKHRWPQTNRGWWKHQRFGRLPFGSYYAVPYAGFSMYAPGEAEAAYPPPAPAVTTTKGVVRLEITPAIGLEYYVDGVLIGTSSQLGSEFEMNAGARQVEVRARGFKPIVFDARIDEGRVTTLRGTLEPLEQAQAPRHPGSRVMYVIPGCYIGNAKPDPGALPAGCDVRKLITRGNGL